MKKYNQLENMMINIVEFGEKEIWLDIEIISDPIERAKQKGLYYKALKKINKEKDKKQ